MGTTAIITIHSDVKEPICCIEVMYDGYPEGLGRDLTNFLKRCKFVNGLPIDDTNCVNGSGDLAAQLVTFLKTRDGRVQPGYVYLIDSKHARENPYHYEYSIFKSEANKLILKCNTVGTLYESEKELPIIW